MDHEHLGQRDLALINGCYLFWNTSFVVVKIYTWYQTCKLRPFWIYSSYNWWNWSFWKPVWYLSTLTSTSLLWKYCGSSLLGIKPSRNNGSSVKFVASVSHHPGCLFGLWAKVTCNTIICKMLWSLLKSTLLLSCWTVVFPSKPMTQQLFFPFSLLLYCILPLTPYCNFSCSKCHLSGLQTMIPSQQPSYQNMMGVQQPQNPGLLNSQRAGMGAQMQSIMVQYPQMPSYQVWSVLSQLYRT